MNETPGPGGGGDGLGPNPVAQKDDRLLRQIPDAALSLSDFDPEIREDIRGRVKAADRLLFVILPFLTIFGTGHPMFMSITAFS